MSNKTVDSLVWNSPVGVLTTAMDLASRSDFSRREQEAGTVGSRRPRRIAAGTGLPLPLAAVGLLFVGFVLGTALVATVIS